MATWGDNLASFSIRVSDAHGESNTFVITISVYHVDKAPTVVAYEYQSEDVVVSNFTSITINEYKVCQHGSVVFIRTLLCGCVPLSI